MALNVQHRFEPEPNLSTFYLSVLLARLITSTASATEVDWGVDVRCYLPTATLDAVKQEAVEGTLVRGKRAPMSAKWRYMNY